MKKKILFTFVATILVLTNSNSQITDYISGLNSPTKMTLDGTTIYVNGWEDIYSIDTSAGSPSANLIYTLPANFYCYKTQKIGNDLFILVENYIEATDEFFGSRILKLDLTNTSAGTQVIVNTTNFISSFTLHNNTLFYLEEIETAPDVFTISLYSFDAFDATPIPTLEFSNLDTGVVEDMDIYNNTLYISARDFEMIKSLDLSSGASTLEDYVIGLNFNKGTFLSQNNELYICNAHQIEKIDINDSQADLEFVGDQTIYQDLDDEGDPYYANFRDVVLIGNTLYMTLEEQGRIVTLTDMTLDNEAFSSNKNSLKVYPNPVKDILHVDIHNEAIKTVELYNLNGQKLDTFNFGFESLSVNHLSEGLYLFKVSTHEGKTHVLKFVKE